MEVAVFVIFGIILIGAIVIIVRPIAKDFIAPTLSDIQDDYEAIESDWKAVGDDIRSAINIFGKDK